MYSILHLLVEIVYRCAGFKLRTAFFFLKGVQCDIERVQCANAPNYINQGQDMSCKIHVGCYRIPAKVPKTEAGRLAWLTSDVRGFKVLDAAKVRTLKFYSIYFYTLY